MLSLSRKGFSAQQHVQMDGDDVEVVPLDVQTRYLGRVVSVAKYHDDEVQNRIDWGWAKFAVSKKELCDKTYPLYSRLRLFQATVSATVLYGSSSWTLTAECAKKLRVAQKRCCERLLV